MLPSPEFAGSLLETSSNREKTLGKGEKRVSKMDNPDWVGKHLPGMMPAAQAGPNLRPGCREAPR